MSTIPATVLDALIDGQGADAGDVTIPLLAILGVLNGGIDATNLAADAVSTAKILNDAVTASKLANDVFAGWKPLSAAPNTITNLGQHSYSVVFNSVDYTDRLSKGMRFRGTRSSAAPTQCTSLNGTTQYFSKASPNKLTFTDDFVVMVDVKVTSYPSAGNTGTIVSRFNGTSGWVMRLNSDGSVEMFGTNAGSGNFSTVKSLQALPLNKWVRVAIQLDMSSFTATTTTSYVMIDDVDCYASVSRGGTNPTALVQAGNLEIGASNGGGSPFPGKIAQVAIFNAKVTQSTLQGYSGQTLTGTETSIASAYSFNNSITDLNTTTPNDLSANGAAVATNADSPFAQGATAGSLEYGIITGVVFSTNTTVTVQVPEGSRLPTSGGLSAVSYSSNRAPYGFPSQKTKWRVESIFQTRTTKATPASGTAYNLGEQIMVPAGEWVAGYRIAPYSATSTNGTNGANCDLSTASATYAATSQFSGQAAYTGSLAEAGSHVSVEGALSLSTATLYYLNVKSVFTGTTSQLAMLHDFARGLVYADNAYL